MGNPLGRRGVKSDLEFKHELKEEKESQEVRAFASIDLAGRGGRGDQPWHSGVQNETVQAAREQQKGEPQAREEP